MSDEPFNPGKYALEALVAAGDLEAAGKLAVKLSAAAPAAAPAAPTIPDPDRLLSYKQLREMTMEQMSHLQHEEPQVVQRSLEALRAGGERHNRDSNSGK